MERDLNEVCASQDVMLDNLGKPGARLPPDKLKQVYAGQINAIKRLLEDKSSDVAVLYVKHRDALRAPYDTARRLEQFMGRDLDVHAMAAVVDPALHRQRLGEMRAEPAS